jgi:hypothetical protein
MVKILLWSMLLGIAPLGAAMLGSRIKCLLGGGLHELFVRPPLWRASPVGRGLRWADCRPGALPQPVARRWNVACLYGSCWEAMAALSELARDDIQSLSRCSEREVPVSLRLRPRTCHGQLKSPRLGPRPLN